MSFLLDGLQKLYYFSRIIFTPAWRQAFKFNARRRSNASSVVYRVPNHRPQQQRHLVHMTVGSVRPNAAPSPANRTNVDSNSIAGTNLQVYINRMAPVIYSSSRGWGLYGAIASLGLLAGFLWYLSHPQGRITALAPEGIIACSFTFLYSLGQIIRPPQLTISSDGFSVQHPLWATTLKWSEIDDVWLLRRLHSPLLVWRLKVKPIGSFKFSTVVGKSYDGALPLWWHGKQPEIALRMIDALEVYSRGQ